MFGWESWMWLAIIVLSVICEAQTAALVAIWFMPAALISIIISFFNVPIWIQVIVFFAISAISIFMFRKIFNNHIKDSENAKTNIDAIIGQKAIVSEEICNIEARGCVKINGQIWSARSVSESEIIPVGTVVIIKKVSGVKLICKKAD